MSWRSFVHAYETRYRRYVPPSLASWLDFAHENSCTPFKLYTAIERDLLPFRKQLKFTEGQWNQLEEVAKKYAKGAFLLVEIRNNALNVVESELQEWQPPHNQSYEQVEENLRWLMDPIVRHTPPITTRFVINLHHAPKSPKNATVPIFSSHSEAYHTDDDPTHPGGLALEISNKNRNGVIDTRDSTTRDLLIPSLYDGLLTGHVRRSEDDSLPQAQQQKQQSYFWFWPFSSSSSRKAHQIPWAHRKNSIAWRGSLPLDGQWERYNRNSTDPRIRMMGRWGGGATTQEVRTTTATSNNNNNVSSQTEHHDHPNRSHDQVQIDIAFSELLMPNSNTKEPDDMFRHQVIQQALYEEFRFAPALTLDEMQEYKYLLDIDQGDTISPQFLTLLQSGSLVFKSTRFREWYSERIRNWKDYIPVNVNTSDLAQKLEWANTQPRNAIANIIRHGNETAERYIRPEDMRCYTYRMILEYTTLFEEQSFVVDPRETKNTTTRIEEQQQSFGPKETS